MRFPVVRERVRVKGRSGTFLVLSIDRARAVASITSASKGAPIEEGVPIASILPLSQETFRHSMKPDRDDPGAKA